MGVGLSTIAYIREKKVYYLSIVLKLFSLKFTHKESNDCILTLEGNHISLLDFRTACRFIQLERVALSRAPPCLHHMTSHST